MSDRPRTAADVRLERIEKSFDGMTRAVDRVDLEIAAGEFFALLGPSGCGKTTTLRMIAGFETPDVGCIRVGGQDVTDMPVHKRVMGMIFQSYALFPHRTVAENVAFGLRMRRLGKSEIADRVAQALRQVALEGYENRRPAQLSGGQQQRVALARALSMDPIVMLFDEPTSALDPIATASIERLIDELKSRVTILVVTHNMQQAARVSDFTAYMYLGELIEFGVTDTIFIKPKNKQTEDYITGRFG
jgi:ABC-type Fe3+/spermidine/putrescine transport system ATPase subunit